jgi:hypothetical protein
MRVPAVTSDEMSMNEQREFSALRISPVFGQFVEDELLPAIGVSPEVFWPGLESIINAPAVARPGTMTSTAHFSRASVTW